MKKLITTMAFIALSTISAKAIEMEMFSITAGLAANQGVFGATATETNRGDTNVITRTNKESGVFTESYGSQFLELGVGRFISLGYEHTPDSVSSPTNKNDGRGVTTASVSVDFNDVNTTYIKIRI